MAKVKGDSYDRQLRDLFGRWRSRLKEADSQNKQDLPDVMNELFLGAMFLGGKKLILDNNPQNQRNGISYTSMQGDCNVKGQ
ncbi:hypothetical protein CEXT_23941 [Caerostris extrusa]|uniref:Uncharacterized protein n=1 Tax=Caerostris extrusa TaxID=172846 RepID=A0AAV4NV06_CAEEX|nr:hypothetical protein CEXT_23941 [Caerostris extrusa]